MARRTASAAPRADTRDRLFAAAATEFAAKGFAGTSVDSIAAAARVNKAMLYYHFDSKAALYSEVLRDMFRAVADRIAAHTDPASDPAERIGALVEAIAREAEARPHFPPIWLREIAEGGTHIDKDTFQVIAGILQHVGTAVQEGGQSGRFAPVNPFLVQLGIVGPLLLFFATAQLRTNLPANVSAIVKLATEDVIAHVKRVTLLTLQGDGR